MISLSRSLHGKANTVITLVISAEDGGGLTAPVNARVNVSVVGGSVASPVFEQAQYFFTVSEDVLRGTAIGLVRAAAKTGEDACALIRPSELFSLYSAVSVCSVLPLSVVSDKYQSRNALMCWRVHDASPLTTAVEQISKQQEHALC